MLKLFKLFANSVKVPKLAINMIFYKTDQNRVTLYLSKLLKIIVSAIF